MRQFRRQAFAGFFAALGTLSGCQNVDRPSASVANASPQVETRRLGDAEIADVQVALAKSMESSASPDEVIAAYTAALRKDPQRVDACLRLAVLYDRQAKFEQAGTWYARALALAPGNADVHSSRGYSFYLQSDWESADKHLREAIRLRPEHKLAHNNLGLLLGRRGQAEEALAHFGAAGCSVAEAHANLAYAKTLESRFDEAASEYSAALAADANCTSARTGLAKLTRARARIEAERSRTAAAGTGELRNEQTAQSSGTSSATTP